MTISEGTLVQSDGATPELFVVRGGKRVLIPSLHDFNQTGFSMGDVQVISSAELAKLPLAADGASALDGGLHADLVVDQTLALDLDTDLGAGHFMTTHGALRKTADGGHVDATTRTRTVTLFGGYHGGVNMVYADDQGIPVGMSETQRYGVDGRWIGRSDRTDFWTAELTQDQAVRTASVALFHFWDPNQLADTVRRLVAAGRPIVEMVNEINGKGGGAASS